ncbi:hypothetical protein ACN99C_26885 (plasmid) [Pseudomonas alloputida]|uniref:hypothetical protein n=1 Tax=Pseudomonas alloputida TaxID=1940621 RepID=UPI003B42C3B4
MNDKVQNSDGTPFALTFIKGVPQGSDEVLLFLLDDGSIHQGVIIHRDNEFMEKRAVSTTNPVGGFHEKFEIPLQRVAGYAYCQPLFDTRERSMWFEAGQSEKF